MPHDVRRAHDVHVHHLLELLRRHFPKRRITVDDRCIVHDQVELCLWVPDQPPPSVIDHDIDFRILDDAGDIGTGLGIAGRARRESGDRDRNGRDRAFRHQQFRLGSCERGQQQASSSTCAADQELAAVDRQRRKRKFRHGHCGLIVQSISYETSSLDRR